MIQNHDNLVDVPVTRVSTLDDLTDFREAWFSNSKESCKAILEFQQAFLNFTKKLYLEQQKLQIENEVNSTRFLDKNAYIQSLI
jgi:hypothetical protein